MVLPEFEAGLEMTREALLHLRVPAPEIQKQTEALRKELFAPLYKSGDGHRTLTQLRTAEQAFDLQWVLLTETGTLAGQTIGETEIRKVTGTSAVGVIRDGTLEATPNAQFQLQLGDLVAIFNSRAAATKLSWWTTFANTKIPLRSIPLSFRAVTIAGLPPPTLRRRTGQLALDRVAGEFFDGVSADPPSGRFGRRTQSTGDLQSGRVQLVIAPANPTQSRVYRFFTEEDRKDQRPFWSIPIFPEPVLCDLDRCGSMQVAGARLVAIGHARNEFRCDMEITETPATDHRTPSGSASPAERRPRLSDPGSLG